MLKKFFLSPFVFFPLLTLIVFWPLSLQIFSLKNDALTYYYPVRTLISDALNNHELPLWTPYINMGYPLHADMQSSAWSPVVWIFSFLTNYSLAAFHYELLFYICFAGIGFYYLCREYGWSKTTAFIIAIAYQLSGFMIDSVQFFVCVSSACFLPYILIFFRRLINKQQIKDSLLTALFLYLLFIGGYPSLFIITCYFLLAYGIFVFINAENKKAYLKKIAFPLALVPIAFILLSLPAIISYIQHLPLIDRGKSQSLDFVLENSMPPFSMLSLISPFSTTATTSWLTTDLLMRSTYIGIIPLMFLLYGIFNRAIRKHNEIKFFFITGLIMYALAFGNHFFLRQLAYYVLPLMNTFRHPALFRLFGIFCFLFVAGFSMNEYQKDVVAKKPSYIIKIITGSFGILLLTGIIIAIIGRNEIFTNSSNVAGQAKNNIAQLNFYQRFLMQLPVVLLVLLVFDLLLRRRKPFKFIAVLSVFDLLIATQFNMPVTVIGAKDFATVETIINRNLERFPLPEKTSIEENSFNSIDSFNLTGSKIPFAKKVGRNDYYITPGNLSLQDKFYKSPVRQQVFKNPVLYFADTILSENSIPANIHTNAFAIADSSLLSSAHNEESSIIITHFSANEMQSTVDNKTACYIVYLQNYYPGWKAFIDDKPVDISKVNITFMAVYMPAGKHVLIFKYDPLLIKYSWYVSLIVLLLTLALILLPNDMLMKGLRRNDDAMKN